MQVWEAIPDGVKVFLIFAVILGVYTYENPETVKAWAAVIFACLVLFILTWVGLEKWSVHRAINTVCKGVPENSPMKLETTIQHLRYDQHRLTINMKMPRGDWDAIEEAGLMRSFLFNLPKSDRPRLDLEYKVGHLCRLKYVDFPDMQEAEHAKERLVENLQYLRSRIDQMKRNMQAERVARSVGAPPPSKETHEI